MKNHALYKILSGVALIFLKSLFACMHNSVGCSWNLYSRPVWLTVHMQNFKTRILSWNFSAKYRIFPQKVRFYLQVCASFKKLFNFQTQKMLTTLRSGGYFLFWDQPYHLLLDFFLRNKPIPAPRRAILSGLISTSYLFWYDYSIKSLLILSLPNSKTSK